MNVMNLVNTITCYIVLLAGLNYGLKALSFDIFRPLKTGNRAVLKFIYMIIGLSAIFQLVKKMSEALNMNISTRYSDYNDEMEEYNDNL